MRGRSVTCRPMPDGALDGLLVADFSRVLAGPLCTQTLGDLGADVVKVERPGTGDDTRQWGPPFVDEGSTYYLGLNRSKRSLTLDLRDPGDQRARRRAVRARRRRARVLPPGRDGPARASATTRCASATRAVVYTSISAFGSGEATRELPGYDLLVQAMSGLHVDHGRRGRPAAQARHRARRHAHRALRDDRDARGAAGARRDRRRAARRGVADGQRARRRC